MLKRVKTKNILKFMLKNIYSTVNWKIIDNRLNF